MGLPEFVARFGGLSRDEFLAAVETPHLVFPTQPSNQARLPFLTLRAGARQRESPEDASGVGLRPLPTEPGRLISLGRSTGNDVVVRSGEVSKVHCYFRLGAQGWEVRDAESANGTSVNGEEVGLDWRPLRPADVLVLANFLEVHCLDPETLFEMVQGLRSKDAPSVAPEVARPAGARPGRRFLVVAEEGPLRTSLEEGLLGSVSASRLWSDLAPLIWSAGPGDVVICESRIHGLPVQEFCRIVAKHKPELAVVVVGSAPDLPLGVVQLPVGGLVHELRRRFG